MGVIHKVNDMRDANRGKDIDDIFDALLDDIMQDDDIASRNVLKSLMNPQLECDKALRSLVDFYETHTEDDLIPDDLEVIENWGLVTRGD